MSTFIHNEPTTLSVLQELKVPQEFLKSAQKSLNCTVEVISALPNAFGAICLNPTGLEMFTQNDPISNYLNVFLETKWHQSLVNNDVPHLAGSSIDEFFRHQPSVKESGYIKINNWLKIAMEKIETLKTSTEEGGILLKMDENTDLKRKDGEVCLMLEVVVRFMEGLFQNVAHCKELLKLDTLQILMNLFTLPTLPFDFLNSPAMLSFGYVFKHGIYFLNELTTMII